MRVIAGRAKGIRIEAPPGDAVRPTSDRARERLFAVLEPWLADARCLDLFAGSGALGIEALSRGAASALFVEPDRKTLAVLRANLERTGLEERARVAGATAVAALARLGAAGAVFDLILLDPPYERTDLLQGALETIRALSLLDPEGLVAVERPRGSEPLPDGWEQGRLLEMGRTEILLCRPWRSDA